MVKELEYWRISAWRDYLGNYLFPLRDSSWRILRIFEALKRAVEEKTVKEIDHGLKDLLLGGIFLEGKPYRPGSPPHLCAYFFGIKLEVENWKREKEKARFIVERSKFLDVVKLIYSISDFCLREQSILEYEESKNEIWEDYNSYEKILSALKEFYLRALSFSATNNFFTFLLSCLKQTSVETFDRAFPKAARILDFLQDLGLKREAFEWTMGKRIFFWKEYFPGDPNGPSFLEEYEASKGNLFLEAESFGGGICLLNDIIWGLLSPRNPIYLVLSFYFPEIEGERSNPFFSYLSLCMENIKGSALNKLRIRALRWDSPWYYSTYYLFLFDDGRGILQDLEGSSTAEWSSENLLNSILDLCFLGLGQIRKASRNDEGGYWKLQLETRGISMLY